MRFTERLEGEVLQTLRSTPEACITFPRKAYMDDGSILICRNYRQVRLHRYLSAQLGNPIPRGQYFHRVCETTGCMNPFHHRVSPRAHDGGRLCPNGHEYTPENTLEGGRRRCRACRDARNARRNTGRPRSTGFCRKGLHPLTPDNIYVSGPSNRRCRQCTIDYMRKRRAA